MLRTSATLVAALLMSAGVALAQSADDRKWVNQCLQDNKDAKASRDVVTVYCVCMNNKMSDNETRSISQWEKSNPKAREACDKESGWK